MLSGCVMVLCTATALPSLAKLLPLWSPLSRWERSFGPSYRELWRMLPPVAGIHAIELQPHKLHDAVDGFCEALARVPRNASAVIWSGIAVAYRHTFERAGCGPLAEEVQNRSRFLVGFEPFFTHDASCPRLPTSGPRYLVVPYPTQFHATGPAAVRQHVASIAAAERPHLVAYFAGAHGRQAGLRRALGGACRSSTLCVDFGERVCGAPRHQDALCASANGSTATSLISESDTNIFGPILALYAASEFCLMPGGDTPTRQGLMDALLAGCIPVFFASCTQDLLYEVAYDPFIPRYRRTKGSWGAGDWSVVLDSRRVLRSNGSSVMAELEAIPQEQRWKMRAFIGAFLPRLQYSMEKVELGEYEDAQHVYQAHAAELLAHGAASGASSAFDGAHAARRFSGSAPSREERATAPERSSAGSHSATGSHSASGAAGGGLSLAEACEAEKAAELTRDRRINALTNLSRPFPIADEFPIHLETPSECEALLGGALGGTRGAHAPPHAPPPRLIVAIEVYKQIEMVERVIRRLAHGTAHGFLLHLASDVGAEFTTAAKQLARATHADGAPAHTPPVCVVRSGYIVYRTSTDLRILFSTWRWLLRAAPPAKWDFFVSLSGADYPAVDGRTLSRLLERRGHLSWRLPERGLEAAEAHTEANRSGAWRVPGLRFLEYGLGCEATRNYTRVPRRKNWLFRLVPELAPRWSMPYSSGGIFHRDTLQFLVEDDRARAAYMYFRLFPTAGVEHYWATVYTLADMAPLLTRETVVSCHMQWPAGAGAGPDGGGRFEHKGKGGTAHNTFLDMSQWHIIERELRRCTPFLRKFDVVKEREVLDRIDKVSASLAPTCAT